MAAIKKILVPTDFSKFSDNALKQAVEMAKQNKAKIYLFHVCRRSPAMPVTIGLINRR